MTSDQMWRRIPCSRKQLRLDFVLACGQSFRWKEREPGEWTGVLDDKVWSLKQTNEDILYRVYSKLESGQDQKQQHQVKSSGDVFIPPGTENADSLENILRDYFHLDVDLEKLYEQWSKSDSHFCTKAHDFTGIRILRQDPVENLFSFICSSNNNISRISSMVEKMSERFGDKILSHNGVVYHQFPTIAALAGESVEEDLRKLGFGYRAKYISQTARYIQEHHGTQWLYGLRHVTYTQAKTELMKLCGVGAKVADCVCLMSLNKHQAVPVDTHVWQIVTRDYKEAGLSNTKTITTAVYDKVGDFFRQLWGEYAGWAHSVLFSADLKRFQEAKINSTKRKTSKEPGKLKKRSKKR